MRTGLRNMTNAQEQEHSSNPDSSQASQIDLLSISATPEDWKKKKKQMAAWFQAAFARRSNRARGWNTWSIWRRLIRDPALSDGAFRLWHHYRDSIVDGQVSGENADADHIANKLLHCARQSVYKWNAELLAGGWLAIATEGKQHSNALIVLNGFGTRYAPKPDNCQMELPLGYTAIGEQTIDCQGSQSVKLTSEKVTAKQSGKQTPLSNSKVIQSTESKEQPLLELWKFNDRVKIIRGEIEILKAQPGWSRDKVKSERVKALRKMEDTLLAQVTGIPSDQSHAADQPKPITTAQAAEQLKPITSEQIAELVETARRATESGSFPGASENR